MPDGIYTLDDGQADTAKAVGAAYGEALTAGGFGAVTTEIAPLDAFFAEGYHRQYLAKNPAGYCGVAGTGVTCPIGTGVAA